MNDDWERIVKEKKKFESDTLKLTAPPDVRDIKKEQD